jgi:predicted AlkP superfamily phosphohydrolase/phosphomutase
MPKVIEIGFEGMSPVLLDLWAQDLPTFNAMRQEGIWGEMAGTVPPVSVAGWTSTQTSRSPSVHGCWDEVCCNGSSYSFSNYPNTSSLKTKMLYQLLPLRDKKAATIGLPITSPPPRIPGGYVISDAQGADARAEYTWPKNLRAEVEGIAGPYIFDIGSVKDYEKVDREQALKRIREMDTQRFSLLRHFVSKKQCDYIVAVVLGPDRLARLFYRYSDSSHRKHVGGSAYRDVIKEYYQFMDQQLAQVRNDMDEDSAMFAHSTFGLQRLDGRINLNEWLIREGYLGLHQYPSAESEMMELNIDWSRTRVWSVGYSGAIYLNMKGRESEGIVEASDQRSLVDELTRKLEAMTDDSGTPLKVEIFPGQEIPQPGQYGPDLFAYFNDGHWGTSERVGSKDLYDPNPFSPTGDVSNSPSGYFVLAGPGVPSMAEEMQGVSVLDVAPTILSLMKEPVPEDYEGKSLIETVNRREKMVRDRLAFLGY